MKIALVAIHRGDEYFMHKRNGDLARGAAGKIGFIGGEFEPNPPKKDKSYLAAAVRELYEETGLAIPPERFKQIGRVTVQSDRDNKPALIKAVAFDLDIPSNLEIPLLDSRDEPVTAGTGEIIEEYLGKDILSPATEALFIRHLLKGVVYLGPVNH